MASLGAGEWKGGFHLGASVNTQLGRKSALSRRAQEETDESSSPLSIVETYFMGMTDVGWFGFCLVHGVTFYSLLLMPW